jgi:putative membrane protein
LHRIAHECASLRGSTQLCKDLSGAVDQLADVARIDLAMKTVRSAAIATKTTVNALAPGARRVAVDSRELARRTPSLTTGIARAAAGARRLNVGLQQTSAGARLLATGTPRAGGGAAKINSAAAELATQLERGRTRIPSYTDAERAHLKTVTANPSTATVRRTPVSALAITLIASLALWAVALATYAVIQAVPSSALTIRAATWRVVLNAALPGAALATLTAAAVTAIAAPVLRLGFTRSLSFLAIALLAAYAFVALNQSVIAILGRSGRHASLAVLLLTVSTGVVSTLPGPLYTLTDYLPTHAAVLALRATATGNPGPLRGAVQLAAWLVIGVTATIVITDRRRYLSPRQLRRRVSTPQFPRHAP